MGNEGSRDDSNDNPGLNEHCYNVGFDHATSTTPDPIGDGIDAFPCTTNENANASYGQGYVDGMKSEGR